jgi:hypothetical protein
MRAGQGAVEDDLDVALSLVQPEGNAAYLVDRREAVERFRARALAELAGSWTDVYGRGHRQQRLAWLAVAAVLGVALFARGDRARTLWGLVTIGLMAAAVFVERGAFDLTAANHRESFVAQVVGCCLVVGGASALAFARRRRSVEEALRLQTTMALALLGLTLGHTAIYGLQMGFPLPRPALLFLPLFSTIATCATALVGLVACVVLAVRARRAETAILRAP